MKKLATLLPLFAFLLLAVACEKNVKFDYYYYSDEDAKVLAETLDLPMESPYYYKVNFPLHLSRTGLFARPIDEDKATLGRVLFYDKKLSKDGTISCASCHKQEIGFSDDVAFSQGVSNRSTDRNSFALSSVANFSAYYGTDLNGSGAIRFFWDNRAETVADQSRGSLTNPKEMDMAMHQVANIVATQPYYAPLFKKAYQHFNVTEDLVLESIANFINAMGSYSSKFDQSVGNVFATNQGGVFAYNENFANFTASENRGKQLYNVNCASCHTGNMGRPNLNLANNGIDEDLSGDLGVGGITGVGSDKGRFKVPTLRNVALTAPYMHDGRFATLDDVLEHYSTGVKNHPTLSPQLKETVGGQSQPKKMNFTQQDKQDLLAFLGTLTDDVQRNDPQFSNPFK